MGSGQRQPIYVPPIPAPVSEAAWHPMLDDLERFADGPATQRDEIQVLPRPATVPTRAGHAEATEFYVTVPSAGVVAALRPLGDEMAGGEEVLVAEQLRRRAEAVRAELARTRAAFRTALGPPVLPRWLRPFWRRDTVEDGLEVLRPSFGNALAVLLLGVGVGVAGLLAGGEFPALRTAGAVGSGLAIAYFFVGLWRGDPYRRAFRRTSGLPVRIRSMEAFEPGLDPEEAQRRARGPYRVEAEIVVRQHRNDVHVEPVARVRDGAGKLVGTFRGLPEDPGAPLEEPPVAPAGEDGAPLVEDGAGAPAHAGRVVREADALARSLEARGRE